MAGLVTRTVRNWIRLRMVLAGAVIALLFVLAFYRAFALTVLDHDKMHDAARAQYHKEVRVPGARGDILDRNGIALAVSVEVPSIEANPRKLRTKEETAARRLSAVLGTDPYLLAERFRTNRSFVWVSRQVSPKQAKAVMALGIEGVALRKEPRRFYPNGSLAGQVLGIVDIDGKALDGVELSLDRWLSPSRSVVAGLKDAMGRPVFVDGLPTLGPTSGRTVVLTIDKSIQYEAQQALEETVEANEAKGGALVVMDPRTGEVLAMADAPGFDPNNARASRPDQRRNRAVTDALEPGSVTKIFTLSAVLEKRVAQTSTHVFCENGRIKVDDHVIRDSHPHKWLTVTQCIQKSSNICTYKLARRIGRATLYQYLRAFGFGSRTGIRLPGERKGRIRPWRRWSEAGLANISFGQGFTVTAVQLAAALSALGNGGIWRRPRILKSVRDADGNVTMLTSSPGRRVVGRWVARKVIRVMQTVVQPGGTGVQAALDDWRVAGKTGTAQKVDPETGSYSKDRWVASFIGLVPADNPRLAIVVMVDEPKVRHYGGEVAAPAFARVAEAGLKILGVPPTKPRSHRRKKRARPPGPTESLLPAAPPLPTAPVEGGEGGMPDFSGLTIHQALALAHRHGLTCRFSGTGLAVHQVPAPGGSVGGPCQVDFEPPR